jgi:phage shock protein A
VQKRLLLEQQLKSLRQEQDEERAEKEQLKKELNRLSKKYGKAKEKKDCEKCKGAGELSAKLEKEREIYFNDRKILQD